MLDQYKETISTNEIIERVNKENLYADFVNSQENGFFEFMNYVYDVIENLKNHQIILKFEYQYLHLFRLVLYQL